MKLAARLTLIAVILIVSVIAVYPAAAGRATSSAFFQSPIDTPTPIPPDTATPIPPATATPVPPATATPVPPATATPVPPATATPIPPATATPYVPPTSTPIVPFPTATPGVIYPVLGTHVVRYGETLYCIGRAYRISPWAIAQQNRIVWPYPIYVGQLLQIPNVPWYNVPPGPTCVPQFGYPPVPTATPGGPTATPSPMQCRYYHLVVWGNTLYGIAWRYNSNIYAIAQVNHIYNINLIYVGQTLCIP